MMEWKTGTEASRLRKPCCNSLISDKNEVIGLQGFEPWTSPTRTARSTKLSHSPNLNYRRSIRGKWTG